MRPAVDVLVVSYCVRLIKDNIFAFVGVLLEYLYKFYLPQPILMLQT